jgi:hypothetical protein
MAAPSPKLRPDVSLPGLLSTVRRAFEDVPDKRRQASVKYSMPDTLMAGLAIFSLKYPSLLMFDQHARPENPIVQSNLQSLFGLNTVPCDTQLRTILDPVKPEQLRPAFRAIHSGLQRSNSLRGYTTLGGKLVVSIDGTGTFSSTRIHCCHCCEKKAKKKQKEQDGLEYYHQLLVAAVVHPERGNCALVLDFEPITRADGSEKNDCERNAGKRLIPSIARQYPKRDIIVTEDALAANGPHIKTLLEHRMDYIIVVKEGSNESFFKNLMAPGVSSTEWETQDPETGLLRGYRFAHDIPLNDTHPDLRVNSLDYWEVDSDGVEHNWHWITNLPITPDNAYDIMRAGRSRWRVENEVFLTLKKQGYNAEHSYGHGKRYLSSVLGGLMLLAFLIDQVQEGFCRVFQAIKDKHVSRRSTWEQLRGGFRTVYAPDWPAFMSFWHDPASVAFRLPSSGIG